MGSESLISGLKGTPHWMAPEVIKGQQSENGWGNADIWSVGCTVVEMLTAQMPWSIYPNPMAAMYHIANGERPPLPKEIESSIPPECKNFIFDCCCNVDPLKRSTVFALLEHPWLVQALESAAMADAEGSRTWLPGPIDYLVGWVHSRRDAHRTNALEHLSESDGCHVPHCERRAATFAQRN